MDIVSVKPEREETARKNEGQSRNKKSVRAGAAVPALVLTFTMLFGAFSVLLPKRAFSDTENRMLAERPALTFSSVADGSFILAAEAYFTDHFAGRDAWLRLNGIFQKAMGKRELNGVYVGKKGHLFLIPTAPEADALQNIADAVNAFALKNKDVRCCFAVAPNANAIQKEYLPGNVLPPDQKAEIDGFYGLLKNVKTVDLYTALSAHKQEYLYYLTDHHWTSLGAKYAFEAIGDAIGIPARDLSCRRIVAAENFAGTLASKTGLFNVYDSVELFVPETDAAYYVLDPATGEKDGSMYKEEYLAQKDKYAVLFGGNRALTVIRTTAENGRRLLVFKDSYANALMQFMYPYFSEIVMVDPRYFYDDLTPVINQYGITDALFLYNADTLWADTSLADVLAQ